MTQKTTMVLISPNIRDYQELEVDSSRRLAWAFTRLDSSAFGDAWET